MAASPLWDVREEPWVLVRAAGGSRMVGLRELFVRAHEISDIAVPVPPAASGLLRILVVMAARIAGLADPVEERGAVEWLDDRDVVLEAGRFDPSAVGAYFDREDLAGRFFVFGSERPFLQDASLAEQCGKKSGLNKIVFGRAAGNNPVWWGPACDVSPSVLPVPEALWHLIAQHYYGPSGRCTARTVDGKSEANSLAGPLRKSLSFHPVGQNLFETLVMGIPRPQETDTEVADAAPWEETHAPDPRRGLCPVTWPGRLLSGRSRHAMLLVPSPDGQGVVDAYQTWASRHTPLEATDPYVITETSQQGNRYAREAREDRALWRDLDALLLKSSQVAGRSRPLICDDLVELPSALRRRVRLRAYGFVQDGQQGDKTWFAATSPPVLEWLEEQDGSRARRIAACRESAEQHSRILEFAAKLAWAESVSPPLDEGEKARIDPKAPGPWRQAALLAYWPQAEKTFWRLIEGQEDPRTAFVSVAEEALRAGVGRAERGWKQARAISHARAVLHKQSKELQ
ncbi:MULTISPECIES: type I-E CRISPR-associated protein Cse1/CasA [Streptomyces]|nr:MULTISPECIES: type I-E CRISPR-associated protein Cse1/CasA [Streptomyces]UVN59452.1 type I-E CRISPR-associated protein Cse1/CasA [Streptomyces albus]